MTAAEAGVWSATDDDVETFTMGGCGILALALADLVDGATIVDNRSCEWSVGDHWAVEVDGVLYDVTGRHDPADDDDWFIQWGDVWEPTSDDFLDDWGDLAVQQHGWWTDAQGIAALLVEWFGLPTVGGTL